MTLPQAEDILEYWREFPPENEMLALFAQVYTTWRASSKPMTPEEHRKSLEDRWASGWLNPKQMFEMMGGSLQSANGDPGDLPGIGRFPGT